MRYIQIIKNVKKKCKVTLCFCKIHTIDWLFNITARYNNADTWRLVYRQRLPVQLEASYRHCSIANK